MIEVYVDTSALIKWYLPEPGSEEFSDFAASANTLVTSRLTVLELRCMLARRRRAQEIDLRFEHAVFTRFNSQVAAGEVRVNPIDDRRYHTALGLIDRVHPLPLRTLDSLHLASALHSGMDVIATADRGQAAAAEALGLSVHFFGASRA